MHVERDVCLSCSGLADDLSIEDSDLQMDIWQINHPGGKTKVSFLEEYEE